MPKFVGKYVSGPRCPPDSTARSQGQDVRPTGTLTLHTRRDPYVEVQQAVPGDADTFGYRVLSRG